MYPWAVQGLSSRAQASLVAGFRVWCWKLNLLELEETRAAEGHLRISQQLEEAGLAVLADGLKDQIFWRWA